MMNKKWLISLGAIVVMAPLVIWGTGFISAAEHPGEEASGEHPGQEASHEHPGEEAEGEENGGTHEHPGEETHDRRHSNDKTSMSGPDKKTFSSGDIESAIKSYVRRDQRLKNGFFYIYDEELNRDWKLSFDKLHPVRIINRDGKKIYFACSDFAVQNGDQYSTVDLDFWMKAKNGKLEPYKIRIHKVDGNDRFTYQDDKPVKSQE